MSIFDHLREAQRTSSHSEGRLNIKDRLRSLMRLAIKQSDFSIHQIAGEMSHLVGETITPDVIYSWTRETDSNNGPNRRHIPAELLPAFCEAAGSADPIELLGQAVGLFVLPGEEALRAEIQKLDEEERKIKARKRKRSALLKELQFRTSIDEEV